MAEATVVVAASHWLVTVPEAQLAGGRGQPLGLARNLRQGQRSRSLMLG